MHGDLGRRQPEDQPAPARIHVVEAQHIADEGPICVGILAVDDHMRAVNHDVSLAGDDSSRGAAAVTHVRRSQGVATDLGARLISVASMRTPSSAGRILLVIGS
jgi:hypothetical protein